MQNGLTHVYIGDGKGKSTAGFGLALRCYGSGGRVLILQFLKTQASGEVDAISAWNDSRFQVLRFESEHDLVFDDATELDLEYLKRDVHKAYEYAYKAAISGDWDLVFLDEFLWALYFNLLSVEQVLKLMKNKSVCTELVITGRNAPESVLELADYITNMQGKKHPYNSGIQARKGIEF